MKAPSDETRKLAGEVSDMLRPAGWSEANEALKLVIAYMYTAIDDDAERAYRAVDLINGAMLHVAKFRAVIEAEDGPTTNTLQ